MIRRVTKSAVRLAAPGRRVEDKFLHPLFFAVAGAVQRLEPCRQRLPFFGTDPVDLRDFILEEFGEEDDRRAAGLTAHVLKIDLGLRFLHQHAAERYATLEMNGVELPCGRLGRLDRENGGDDKQHGRVKRRQDSRWHALQVTSNSHGFPPQSREEKPPPAWSTIMQGDGLANQPRIGIQSSAALIPNRQSLSPADGCE